MKTKHMLAFSFLFLWRPACYGQNVQTRVASNGVFTNRQMNENLQSLVNSCDPAKEFHAEQGENNATDAVTGCLQVPPDSTVWNAEPLAGYGNNSSITTNAVGVYAAMTCLVSASHCWGSNPLVQDTPGTQGGTLWGEEIDTNIYGAPREAGGLVLTGFLKGTLPRGASAIWVTPTTPGSTHVWPIALNVGVAAATVGVQLSQQNQGNNQPSSTVNFVSTDSDGTVHTTVTENTPSGDYLVRPAKDFQLAAGDFAFTQSKGQHLLTRDANSDTSGKISVASPAAQVSYEFAKQWAQPPICTVTPTSDPTAAGNWWVTTSTSRLTVNLKKGASLTFNYICVGNPN